jgi:hypothetical protein
MTSFGVAVVDVAAGGVGTAAAAALVGLGVVAGQMAEVVIAGRHHAHSRLQEQ